MFDVYWYNVYTILTVGSIAGGFMFIFAFGDRIEDWYNKRQEKKK